MRIAVDAMGGDRGPDIIAQAAVNVARSYPDSTILLIGDREAIEKVLARSANRPSNVEIVHASEVVGMNEAPANAIRKKKDSSIAVAIQMVKDDKADALVSAGNTGAVVAGSLVKLGRLHGVSRPAIATFYPSNKGWVVLLDIGANSDCVPKNLAQFGVMGSVFAQYLLGVSDPRVGLLNIGEESTKGSEMVKRAYPLLAGSNINFVGNVEGRDVFAHAADVVVCDGFVGNVVLKFSESILSFVTGRLRKEVRKSVRGKIGAFLMKNVFSSFRASMDYAEVGGAPLLGVKGVVIISHGKSSVRAMQNAIIMAQRFVKYGINGHIEDEFRGQVDNLANVR
ncbi:MAG: phosphate acyltransferase PlsX [bacterium]|nr:phosphate acyltransferase PlsX [bacterium]